MDVRGFKAAIGWRMKRYVGDFTTKIVYVRELRASAATPPASDLVFKVATREDLLALPHAECTYAEDDVVFGLERLQAGDELTLGYLGGALAWLGWTMFGQMDLDCRNYISLLPTDAYSYKGFTLPRFRGQRVLSRYHEYHTQRLIEQGCTRVFTWVDVRNTSSLKAHDRAGLQRVATYRELRIRGCAPRFFFNNRFKQAVGISSG